MIVATTIGAAAHTDNPSRVGHLVVDLAESRGHLVRQCSSHNHHIGLSGGCSENDTKTILVVSGCGKVHHLDGAAGETESHGPQRALASPIENLVKSRPGKKSEDGYIELDYSGTHKTYCIALSFFS